jgi:hypothetical protein
LQYAFLAGGDLTTEAATERRVRSTTRRDGHISELTEGDVDAVEFACCTPRRAVRTTPQSSAAACAARDRLHTLS